MNYAEGELEKYLKKYDSFVRDVIDQLPELRIELWNELTSKRPHRSTILRLAASLIIPIQSAPRNYTPAERDVRIHKTGKRIVATVRNAYITDAERIRYEVNPPNTDTNVTFSGNVNARCDPDSIEDFNSYASNLGNASRKQLISTATEQLMQMQGREKTYRDNVKALPVIEIIERPHRYHAKYLYQVQYCCPQSIDEMPPAHRERAVIDIVTSDLGNIDKAIEAARVIGHTLQAYELILPALDEVKF